MRSFPKTLPVLLPIGACDGEPFVADMAITPFLGLDAPVGGVQVKETVNDGAGSNQWS